MGDDEVMIGESAFRQACFIEGKTFEGFGQVGVTAGGSSAQDFAGDGQNELPQVRQLIV